MPEGHGTKKNILEFGNSKCEGPETRVHSVWLETSRKTKYGHNEQELGRKEWEMEHGSPGPLGITVRIGVLFWNGVHSFERL